MRKILDVYMDNNKAGELSQEETGSLSFSYDPDYLISSKLALSVFMPLRAVPYTNDIDYPSHPKKNTQNTCCTGSTYP